ncbi:hypothetical protein ACJJTC_009321 [Scirpophaga incertulas]
MRALAWAAFVVCASAFDLINTQYIKSVKGGSSSSYQYKGGDVTRYYNNNTQAGGYGRPTGQIPANFEVGVCYKEVPTATLVKDPAHVPVGNGSLPQLSRIRTCCEGYKRNVYNYLICEPVCSKECVNALCSAPEVCTCFPDHVRNLAGVCVATCPIGCQNGYCVGGECLCKEGYKLDIDGRFCVPSCKGNCGGIGNCTAPNTCECKPGYQSSPDGSCKLPCDHCVNGECLEPNVCRCRPGFTLLNGVCEPHCQPPCGATGRCISPNVCSNSFSSNQGSGYIHQQGSHIQNQSYPNPSPYKPQYTYGQSNQSIGYPITITHNVSYTPIPPYPGNQVFNSPYNSSGFGQQPQNPTNQYPYGPVNPQQPHVQNASVAFPPQYPLYPGGPTSSAPNQGGSYYRPSTPGTYPYPPNSPLPNQSQQNEFIPNYPSVNITIPSQYPLYPSNQLGPGPHNNYPSNPPNNYPHPPNPQGGPNPTTSQNEYTHFQSNDQRFNYSGYYGGHNYPANTPGPRQPYPDYSNSGSHGGSSIDQFAQSYDSFPVCSSPCVNGVCVENNQCRCNPGYIRDDDDITGRRCEPYCPGGCPNGYCTAPHSCACDVGYHKDTSVKGRPLCIKNP